MQKRSLSPACSPAWAPIHLSTMIFTYQLQKPPRYLSFPLP